MQHFGPDMQAIAGAASAPAQPPVPTNLARMILYGLQAYDAVNSANAFAHHGEHETDPLMQPFSHGGAPTMALGFGLYDLLHHALLRHASQGTRNTADFGQAALNAAGILQTNRNKQP